MASALIAGSRGKTDGVIISSTLKNGGVDMTAPVEVDMVGFPRARNVGSVCRW